MDLKLFDAIVKRSSENENGSVEVHQLSEDVSADSKLVGKFSSRATVRDSVLC